MFDVVPGTRPIEAHLNREITQKCFARPVGNLIVLIGESVMVRKVMTIAVVVFPSGINDTEPIDKYIAVMKGSCFIVCLDSKQSQREQ